ncbi:hypothetical protein K1T71_000942 [Dendrolimus kikuchii]|uniref:Uncharacterized protein n=1 Tax=Dendrolimus kikuchii TaxID=765133 RepID=A0ACC1DGE6_9NEOP|nr:hypothetical protein K1T71_000942 [Dendrolimus kikuchii]
MAKKDKKKKDEQPAEPENQDEVLVATTDLEPEPEEVQYTDTSYTSASFESLPPVIEEPKAKKKKGKLGKKSKSELVVVQKKTSSALFQWSEESLAEEQVKVEEEQKEEKKKRGKKKGKKGKQKEDIPDFEKPKNWKKMNRKEREAWMIERIEQWHAEKEAEKQAILAGAKEKRATLARERAELMAKDNAEQELRSDLLQKTVNLFQKFEQEKYAYENKKQLEAVWQQYLRCDGLPDPRVATEMNTYIHLWQKIDVFSDNELEKRCIEATPMLEMLEEFVANSRQYTSLQAETYNQVRLALREQLSNTIQGASYYLLRNLEKNLKWDSIKLATFEKEFKGLRLNFWVAVRMPTRKPKLHEQEPEPVELSFPAMRVTVKLPKIIDGSCVCVRAARSMIDLLSESTRSYALAADMPNLYTDLFVFNEKEHIETYKVKKEQDDIRNKFYKEIREKVRELENFLKANPYTKNEKEKEDLDNLNMAEPPFLPDPRTFISEQNELAFAKYLKTCMTRTRTGELNMRKYRICGGVLNLDLLTTPPQPKRLRGCITFTTCEFALLPVNHP